jgi:predicted O-methyltransferase YrrM
MPDTAIAADPLTQGWFNHGSQILALVERYRPVVCVELGTWQGASAIPVARAIRRWGGALTCVDNWRGNVNAETRLSAMTNVTMPWMLANCARNLIQAEVNTNVRLIVSDTVDAAIYWTQPIDYLYVDADHSYEGVLADLRAWVPYVRPGGLILGDDYGSDMYPGVKQAWDQFEREHRLSLTRYQSTPADRHGIQLIYGTKKECV